MDPIAYWKTHLAPFVRAWLRRSEGGAALVEYALLVALIAVACIGAITLLGSNLDAHYSRVGSAIQ